MHNKMRTGRRMHTTMLTTARRMHTTMLTTTRRMHTTTLTNGRRTQQTEIQGHKAPVCLHVTSGETVNENTANAMCVEWEVGGSQALVGRAEKVVGEGGWETVGTR